MIDGGLHDQILTTARDIRDRTGRALVGFDVFDTLLTRIIPKEAAHDAMCRALALRFLGASERFAAVADLFQAVYAASCADSVAQGADHEAWTPDLLAGLAEGLGALGAACDVTALKAALVDHECRLLRPMPHMAALLQALADEGIACVFVSDMFLGREIVGEILARFGLAPFFQTGYVSSDVRRLKRTGTLFPKVLADLDITPSQVLFVGDDPEADVARPRALGITAIHATFPDIEADRADLRQIFAAGAADRADLPRALVRAAAGPDFECRSAEAFAAGKYLGPYFAAFAHAVQRRYASGDYGKILFAAREGLFLMRLTDMFDRVLPVQAPVGKVYFPASRLTAMAFGLATRDFGLGELRLLLRNGAPCLRTALSFLRMDDGRLAEIAAAVGLPDADTPFHGDWLNWAPIHRIVDAVNSSPEFANFRDEGALFERWMTEQGLFDGRPKLLVDLGWSGQIQEAISRGFARRGITARLDGAYSGLRLEAHWLRREGGDLLAYHGDETDDDILSKAPLWAPQILETLCRAPHGTCVGFRDREGAIEPQFLADRPPAEMADDALIARLQELVLAYAERFAYLVALYALSPDEMREASRLAVFKFTTCPETEVARRFAGFCNVSDLGATNAIRFRGGMGAAGLDDARFAALEAGALWRGGAVAAFFGEAAAASYSEQTIRDLARKGRLVRRGGLIDDARGGPPPPPEAVIPANTAAVAAWASRVSALADHVQALAAAHGAAELTYRDAIGPLTLSAGVEQALRDLVARAVNEPERRTWPLPRPQSVSLSAAAPPDLVQAKADAEALARERYQVIRNMDAMIRERDQTIRAQGVMLEDRFAAMQEMGALIRQRDRDLGLLRLVLRPLSIMRRLRRGMVRRLVRRAEARTRPAE